MRVHRNHFGRQIESFVADVELPFLAQSGVLSAADSAAPFPGVFIRAPIVEQLLVHDDQLEQQQQQQPLAGGATVPAVAPGVVVPVGGQEEPEKGKVEILGVLPDRTRKVKGGPLETAEDFRGGDVNNIVAIRQGRIMGTSFHPELTDDIRIHVWWLEQVLKVVAET